MKAPKLQAITFASLTIAGISATGCTQVTPLIGQMDSTRNVVQQNDALATRADGIALSAQALATEASMIAEQANSAALEADRLSKEVHLRLGCGVDLPAATPTLSLNVLAPPHCTNWPQ